MSDTVKMVVEIPAEQYNRIIKAPRCVDFNEAVEDRSILLKALREGTSLDLIMAEIEKLKCYVGEPSFPLIEVVNVETVLEILDNIGKAESEGE